MGSVIAPDNAGQRVPRPHTRCRHSAGTGGLAEWKRQSRAPRKIQGSWSFKTGPQGKRCRDRASGSQGGARVTPKRGAQLCVCGLPAAGPRQGRAEGTTPGGHRGVSHSPGSPLSTSDSSTSPGQTALHSDGCLPGLRCRGALGCRLLVPPVRHVQ